MWQAAALLIAALVLLPVVAILWIAAHPQDDIWRHLLTTELPRYLCNSLILMAGSGAIAALAGTVTAWLVVMTRFPLRGVLEWGLLLPLAVPAYIAAYAIVDFTDYAGPLQTGLRAAFGWKDASSYWFPDFRSMGGAILVMSMAFSPYVHVLVKAALQEQAPSFLNVGRALGCSPRALFWRVALPLARPAIWAGTAIVMMEVLGDFGAVDHFAVQTLTTGVFSVWTQGNNPGGAAQIACVALVVILALVWIERRSRAGQRFHGAGRGRHAGLIALSPMQGLGAMVLCLLPVLLGFVLPTAILLNHAVGEPWVSADLIGAAQNSVMLAVLAAALIVAGALLMVFATRQSRRVRALLPLTTLGYAAPGAVLALGVLIPFAAFDNRLADLVLALSGREIGLLLTGSIAALVFALFVRFFAVGQSTFDAALGRVSPSMDMAARTLGQGQGGTLWHVHLPMIRGSVLVACLLVLVDTIKELPATLMLRPFNFETLSTLTFNQASLEDIGGASPPALLITATGLIPVLVLAFLSRQGGGKQVGVVQHG